MTTSGPTTSGTSSTVRVAVVAGDPATRSALAGTLGGATDVEVVAWADALDTLVVLGTRADVCLCVEPPPPAPAARLRERGCRVVVTTGHPVTAVRQAIRDGRGTTPPHAPSLAPRQREVLIAYVSSSDLLPTVARALGMDRETLKTHLRRIRAKYAELGRPAPTRRDLYVRAVEDGLLAPPSGRPWR